MKNFSMNKTAQIFGKDRATLYAWIRRGCPWGKPEGPGKPASMDFKAVLQWRLAQLAGFGYTKEELQVFETQARGRLKELRQCKQ